MFIHTVLFEIAPREVADYRKDSLMWARYAKKAEGFVAYFTMQRFGFRNQYASVYEWRSKRYHDHFMKKFHQRLVSKSKAKVKVLGYYNLKNLDKLRNGFIE
jgi:tRNA(Glu) U13 pseudouridine synthase TruD